MTMTTNPRDRVAVEAVRSLPCTICWAGAGGVTGEACGIIPEGDHFARWAAARKLGLITADQLGVAIDTLSVVADRALVETAPAAGPGETVRALVNALGAIWSDDFDASASGRRAAGCGNGECAAARHRGNAYRRGQPPSPGQFPRRRMLGLPPSVSVVQARRRGCPRSRYSAGGPHPRRPGSQAERCRRWQSARRLYESDLVVRRAERRVSGPSVPAHLAVLILPPLTHLRQGSLSVVYRAERASPVTVLVGNLVIAEHLPRHPFLCGAIWPGDLTHAEITQASTAQFSGGQAISRVSDHEIEQ